VQGYFGGWLDLIFQRIIEIWNATPSSTSSSSCRDLPMKFLAAGVPDGAVRLDGAVGVVRAEFLRARNFEYVRAARALGVSNGRSCSATCCPTRWWRR
jgi:microcin C transport system permease protein